MFKNIRLAILFDMFHNLSFEMTTRFDNVARITTCTSTFLYWERFLIIKNWVFT